MLNEFGFEDLRIESMRLEASRTELLSLSNSSNFERVNGSKFNCTARIISRSDMVTNKYRRLNRPCVFRGERAPKVIYKPYKSQFLPSSIRGFPLTRGVTNGGKS